MGTSGGPTTATSTTRFDPDALAQQVGALGREVAPSVLEASQQLYAPFHQREPYQDVRLTRDVAYGDHPRQRLDVFTPTDGQAGGRRPVLVFFHGGGFVRGDKHHPGTPYYDNVALWAVRHGLVGVNATYRLAPASTWPSGGEDVAGALAWTRATIAEHGGDPERIYLLGTSAGAVHVASYLAHPEFHLPGGIGAAGGILLSGIYDLTTSPPEVLGPYLGEDRARYAACSSLRGLVEEPVPLLFTVTEFDPPSFERQVLAVVAAYQERHGRWPRLVRVMGHNHFTVTLHFNTPDDWLGRQILRFIRQPQAAGAAGDRLP